MSTDPNTLALPLAMKALEDYAAGKKDTFSVGDAAIVLDATKRMSGTIMKQIQIISMMTQTLPQVELAVDAAHRAVAGLNTKLAEAFVQKPAPAPQGNSNGG